MEVISRLSFVRCWQPGVSSYVKADSKVIIVDPDSDALRGRLSVLRRLHAGIALSFVGSAFNQGSTFALNLLVANLVGRYAFGEFTVVQSTLATAATIGQFATGYTATKHIAEFRERDPQRASRILHLCNRVSTVTATLTAGALLFGAPFIATTALGVPAAVTSLRIAALAVLFVVMNGFRSGALAGLERYHALARVGIVSGTIYLLVGACGTAVGGVPGALVGIGLSAGAQWTILGRALRRELARHGLTAQPDAWKERQTLIRFALPASLAGLISLPAIWWALAILTRQPNGLNEIALFGAANSFRVIVMFLPGVLTTVGMSLLNNQRGSSAKSYRWVFWWTLALTATCAAVAATLIVVLGPMLFQAFGKDFGPAYAPLRVLMIAAVIEAIAIAIYQVIQTQGRMWLTLFLISVPRDALIVGLAYALTPTSGAVGLSAAIALGWTLALVVITVLAFRLWQTPTNYKVQNEFNPTYDGTSH